MNLEKELKENSIVLSVFDKNYYNDSLYEVMKSLKNKRLCYVTLNRGASSLLTSFRLRRIPTGKIFFIDAVSQSLGKTENSENIIFVSSPKALTELSLAITESLKTGFFDAMVFDSLSALNMYERGKSSEQFASHVMNKVKSEDKKGVFTCLEDDLQSNLIKNSCMYVDKVLSFKPFYQAMKNRKRNLAAGSMVAVLLLAAVPLFSTYSGSSLTGLSIAATTLSPLKMLFLPALLAVGLILVILVLLFRRKSGTALLTDLPETRIGPQDKVRLQKNFRKKIKNWFEKTKHLGGIF